MRRQVLDLHAQDVVFGDDDNNNDACNRYFFPKIAYMKAPNSNVARSGS